MTRVNMRKQDLQGYTGYTVLVGYRWVNRTKTRVNRVYSIHRGLQGIQYYYGKHE